MNILILFTFLFTTLIKANNDEIYDFEYFKTRCTPNCTFGESYLNAENINTFPTTCSSVCSYLLIDGSSGVTEQQLKETFKNIRKLYGSLMISKTGFKSASFFADLETLECDIDTRLEFFENSVMQEVGMTNLTTTSCSIIISRADNLTRLNMPNLKNFYLLNPSQPRLSISISSSNAFCITIGEVTNFLRSEAVLMGEILGDYCDVTDSDRLLFKEKLCEIKNFSLIDFDTTCQIIVGTVLIGPGDEQHVGKLKLVKWIFGRLIIRKTNLTAIDFLNSLEYVVVLIEFNRPIQILENIQLQNIIFPKLKMARPDIYSMFDIHDNNKKLVSDPSICYGIRRGLNTTKQYIPRIDTKTCEDIEAQSGGTFQVNVFPGILVLVIVLH